MNEPRTSFHGIRYQYFSSSWLEILILPDRGKLRPVHFRGVRSLRRFPPPHFNYKLSRSDRAGWIFKKLRGKGGVLFESSQRGRIDVVYIRSTVENLWSEKKKESSSSEIGEGEVVYSKGPLSREGIQCIIVLTIRQREREEWKREREKGRGNVEESGSTPTILFERLFITYWSGLVISSRDILLAEK